MRDATTRFRTMVYLDRVSGAVIGTGMEGAPPIERAYGPHLHDKLTAFARRGYQATIASLKIPVQQHQQDYLSITDANGVRYTNNKGGVRPVSQWDIVSVFSTPPMLLRGPFPAQNTRRVSYAPGNTLEQMYGLIVNE